MSNSNSSIEKKSYKIECIDCENYKRKVKEAEQSVSGRDVLIEMLQGEIKKMEGRYKASIDDYEKLRFKYCTVVQELGNLKEIHRELEKSNMKLSNDRDIARKQLEKLQNKVLETCKNQCKEMTIELIPHEGVEIDPGTKGDNSFHPTVLKEVLNIEFIMENQNETVKNVLMKILSEMKTTKSSGQIEEVLDEPTTHNIARTPKDEEKQELISIIDKLNNEVQALKQENESIKTQLTEKKSNLAQCLNVLEDNHSNLNNLSGNIEMIITEKDTYLKEIGQLKVVVDVNNMALKQKDDEIRALKNKLDAAGPQSDAGLQRENKILRKNLNECEKELERLQEECLQKIYQCGNEKCKRLAQAMKESNIEGVIEKVNVKSNLETFPNKSDSNAEAIVNKTEDENSPDLNVVLTGTLITLAHGLRMISSGINNNYSPGPEDELKEKNNSSLTKYDQENELGNNIADMEQNPKAADREQISLIEAQNEVVYMDEKQLMQKKEESAEKENLEKQVTALQQQIQEQKQCLEIKVIVLQQIKEEKEFLENQVTVLQQQIKEKEYSENQVTALRQQIKETEHLKNQITALQQQMKEKDKEHFLQLQENIKTGDNRTAKLLEENTYLENQVTALQQQTTREQKDEDHVLQLQEEVKAASKRSTKLSEEKEYLKKQVANLQNEMTQIQERDEKQILILQEKIDKLESSQNEKQKEIDKCCCVVRDIKATIADKNFIEENNCAQISFLEEQNRKLQQQVEALKTELKAYRDKYKGCNCINDKNSTRIVFLEEQNYTLQQQIGALQSELTAYKNKYKGCNCTNKNNPTQTVFFEDQNHKLREQNEILQSQLVACQEKYKGCNCLNETNSTQITVLEDQNRKLREQIEILQSEYASYQNKYKEENRPEKYETEMSNLNAINVQLQKDIKTLESGVCERDCVIEKLQTDIGNMEFEICRRQCTINHLEQCLDNSNKILAECEKEMKQMHVENENLKHQNGALSKDLTDYAQEAERRSTEKTVLQEKYTAVSRQSQALELEKFQMSKNLQEKSNKEDELNQLKKQYEKLLKTVQEKDEELKSVKKQTESLNLAFEASKMEHDKIIRVYKEVERTLSEEIKKYNAETERMDNEKENIQIEVKQETKCTACLNIRELNAIIMEKQRTIKTLDEQIKDLVTERAQLKAYVSKLISDNKNLRSAIEKLLSTLTEKLKNFTQNEQNISLKSNEMIVKDILNSLIDLEKNITEHSGTCKDKCNCMSVITSTYKMDPKDPRARNMTPCKHKCKKVKDVAKYIHSDVCVVCCDVKEKGQKDQPEHAFTRPETENFVIKPDNSQI